MAKYLLSSAKKDIIVNTKDFKKIKETVLTVYPEIKSFMLFDKNGVWVDSGYLKNGKLLHDTICPDGSYQVCEAYAVRNFKTGFACDDLVDYLKETGVFYSFVRIQTLCQCDLEEVLDLIKEHGIGKTFIKMYDDNLEFKGYNLTVRDVRNSVVVDYHPFEVVQFKDGFTAISGCYECDYRKLNFKVINEDILPKAEWDKI